MYNNNIYVFLYDIQKMPTHQESLKKRGGAESRDRNIINYTFLKAYLIFRINDHIVNFASTGWENNIYDLKSRKQSIMREDMYKNILKLLWINEI